MDELTIFSAEIRSWVLCIKISTSIVSVLKYLKPLFFYLKTLCRLMLVSST